MKRDSPIGKSTPLLRNRREERRIFAQQFFDEQREVSSTDNLGENMATHAITQTDYAFALTHSQQEVSDPCQNVMWQDATGESQVYCNLDCWWRCPECDLEACSKSCLADLHRSLGCEKK